MTSQPDTYQNRTSRETKIQEYFEKLRLTESERRSFLIVADSLDYFTWDGEPVDLRGVE